MTGTENMFVKLENNERLQTIAGFLVFEETLSVSAVHKGRWKGMEKNERKKLKQFKESKAILY